jgi:heme exporter protein D
MLTQTIPDFQFAAFFAAAMDFLIANQLAFWLMVLAAGIVVYGCWLHAVKDAALRRVLRDAKVREDRTERLREDLMKAIYRAKGGV